LNFDIVDLIKPYSFLGYGWSTKKEALDHKKSLRASRYGIMKKHIYSHLKVVRLKNKYHVTGFERVDYLRYLQTGLS